MKSADAVPLSAMSALVVIRSAISAVVDTDLWFAFTMTGASCGCASSLRVIDGVALGEGAGDDEADALGEGEGCGVAAAVPGFALGVGVDAGTFK